METEFEGEVPNFSTFTGTELSPHPRRYLANMILSIHLLYDRQIMYTLLPRGSGSPRCVLRRWLLRALHRRPPRRLWCSRLATRRLARAGAESSLTNLSRRVSAPIARVCDCVVSELDTALLEAEEARWEVL